MLRDLRTIHYLVILVCLTILAGSCGSGEFVTGPITPLQTAQQRTAAGPVHQCWGLYDIYISADRTEWDVVPKRGGMSHLNVVPLLEGPVEDSLYIPEGGIVDTGEHFEVTVEIHHPLVTIPDVFEATFWRGFDVKGIVMFPGSLEFPVMEVTTQNPQGPDGRVLNAQGYTRYWNPIEFAEGEFLEAYVEGKMALFPGWTPVINATVHPYRWIYPAGKARHNFPPDAIAQTTYELLLPDAGEPFAVMYAIDAAYEIPTLKPPGDPEPEYKVRHFALTANQPEPYNVVFSKVTNGLWGDGQFEGGGECTLEIDVYDWQDSRLFTKTPNNDRGIRKPVIEAPAFFDDTRKFNFKVNNENPAPNATAAVEVSSGALAPDFIVINGVTINYVDTPPGSTSLANAQMVASAINNEPLAYVYAAAIEEGNLGFLYLEHANTGTLPVITIEVTPNLGRLGLDTLEPSTFMDEIPPYYLIDNGLDFQTWKITFANEKTIIPGWYPIIIATADYGVDDLFPTELQHPESYWILELQVSELIPFICDELQGVHNTDMGPGVITNVAMEYRADSDFIGYSLSPYKGRLIFNKETDFSPGGQQEICVMDLDEPKVAAALKIITLDNIKRGIPLVLQEDHTTGNIILVNHEDQDDVFVFDFMGNQLNTFDYGDGDDAFNSPIALDFDDDGGMWVVSHRGVAGPELRHWAHSSGGVYYNVQTDYVDLTPIFGPGYNILDVAVLPAEEFVLVFSNKNGGHVEFFDTSVSPPVPVPELMISPMFGVGITPVKYPGLRIARGGGLFIDRVDADAAHCRIVAVANLVSGPLAFQKFDFFANMLGVAYLPASGGELSLALNNDPQLYKRRVVAFPIAQKNTFRVYDNPLDW